MKCTFQVEQGEIAHMGVPCATTLPGKQRWEGLEGLWVHQVPWSGHVSKDPKAGAGGSHGGVWGKEEDTGSGRTAQVMLDLMGHHV